VCGIQLPPPPDLNTHTGTTEHAHLFEIGLAGVDCDPGDFAVVGAVAAATIGMEGCWRGLRVWPHAPHIAPSTIGCSLPLAHVTRHTSHVTRHTHLHVVIRCVVHKRQGSRGQDKKALRAADYRVYAQLLQCDSMQKVNQHNGVCGAVAFMKLKFSTC
jgi:hypothetical protein